MGEWGNRGGEVWNSQSAAAVWSGCGDGGAGGMESGTRMAE